MNPGDRIAERFEILRSAGLGGMGVVYKAHDHVQKRDVALKVLVEAESRHDGEQLAERFTHEVELLSTLDHPHIIGYVSHGVTAKGTPYLVMPWLEGEDLEARVLRGPLSVNETLTLALRVAGALSYIHARGLVHRDLKPSNLFLPRGKLEDVKVIDLGIARGPMSKRPITLTGALLGTPGFIAPEQARGGYEVAPSADIFSFGCVLFECLTGQRLFGGGDLLAVLAKIVLEESPRVRDLRPEVPDSLDLLVHRMVAKDPERRPRDGAQLLAWLEDIEHTTPSALRAPAITGDEQRIASVLVVVLPRKTVPPPSAAGATRAEGDPFGPTSARFGVRVVPMDSRTAIAMAPDGVTGADQAALLARFARYVSDTYEGATVAIATGSALAGARVPIGEAIDRGVAIVRAAPPGAGVNVDEVTSALLSSRFDLRESAGRVYLDDERLSLDPSRPLLGQPTACVGRDREVTILAATYAECLEGAGPRVVLVTAAAGIGKSRLRHELVRRLHGSPSPPTVLLCRGDPLHAATPYAQIGQAVRQAAELSGRETGDETRGRLEAHVRGSLPEGDVGRVVDFVGELVGEQFDDGENLPLRAARHSAEAMADQIRRAFEELVRAWCKKGPVVLVLEDLHWTDPASVKLVDAVLRRLEGEALFVLALARPEVHERFPGLWENRHLTELRLPPLPPRAATKLVRAIMGETATDEDIQRIVVRAEGNAFYLEELIRDAAERIPVRRSQRPSLRPDAFPETLIAVAQARLERLDPDARKLLRAASIFGETFSVEGVSALVGEPVAAWEPLLAALIEHEVITHLDKSHYADSREMVFRHALLRGAAYATLTVEDRTLGHRLAGTWLHGTNEDREAIALHFFEAGESSKAAACFAEAAATNAARAQAEASARCALRALLVDGPSTDGATTGARIRMLADALSTTRRIDPTEVVTGLESRVQASSALRSARSGAALVKAVLDGPLLDLKSSGAASAAPAFAWSAGALAALGDLAGAQTLLAEAQRLAANDESQAREVRYAAAKVASFSGEWGIVGDTLGSTLLPADAQQRTDMLLILAIATVAVDGREALSRGLDMVSRAEALATSSTGDPVALVHCQKARFVCFYFAGDHRNAATAAEQAVALAHHAGLRYEESLHLHNLGEQYIRLGEPEKARQALLDSNEIARDIVAERLLVHNEIALAFLDDNASRLKELADGFRGRAAPWHEMHARFWLGLLQKRQASPEASASLLRSKGLAEELKVRVIADDCAEALRNVSPDR